MLNPAQYILTVTIFAIGAIAGFISLRDAIIQDYADAALALRNLNQSYNYQLFDQDGNLIDPDSNGTYTAEYNDTVGGLADVDDIENNVVIVGGSPGMTDITLNDTPAGMAPSGISFPVAMPEGVNVVVPPPGANEIPAMNEGDPLP